TRVEAASVRTPATTAASMMFLIADPSSVPRDVLEVHGVGRRAEVQAPMEVVPGIRALPDVGQVPPVVDAVGAPPVPGAVPDRVAGGVRVDRRAERVGRPRGRATDVPTVVAVHPVVDGFVAVRGVDVPADVPSDVARDVGVVVDVSGNAAGRLI